MWGIGRAGVRTVLPPASAGFSLSSLFVVVVFIVIVVVIVVPSALIFDEAKERSNARKKPRDRMIGRGG